MEPKVPPTENARIPRKMNRNTSSSRVSRTAKRSTSCVVESPRIVRASCELFSSMYLIALSNCWTLIPLYPVGA